MQFGKFEFVLGSSSPRRKEILENNLNVLTSRIIKSTFAEDISKVGLTPEEYVMQTALGKLPSIIEQLTKDSIVVVADTIVSCNDRIFEKPNSPEKNRNMLEWYQAHSDVNVMTAVVVAKYEKGNLITKSGVETTRLVFGDVDIEAYVQTGEGLHVAGGFKYQGLGCLLFKRIEGDYFNVVGLPAYMTHKLLRACINDR